MDVERAIEHLLDLYAKSEVRLDRLEKQVSILGKLMAVGIKQMALVRKAQHKNDAQIEQLMKAQERTDLQIEQLVKAQQKSDAKFDRLIDVLARQGKNGHRKT